MGDGRVTSRVGRERLLARVLIISAAGREIVKQNGGQADASYDCVTKGRVG